jgi:hypothetical protein
MIEIRKLAAVDMAWLGTRVIVTEYALGVMLPLVLGILSLRAGLAQQDLVNWQTILGSWLVTISANYVPLFLYAVAIARAGTVREEGLSEFALAGRYGVQQAIILVPLFVVLIALIQERKRRKHGLRT